VSDRPAPNPPPPVVVSHATGLPGGAEPPQGQRPYATWGEDGTILVVTWGSSRCPQLPVSVELDDPHTVVVRTDVYLPGGPCTRDMVPTTAVVSAPDGLDDTAAVRILVDDVESRLPTRSPG
jgi:hypothetical protein